jgi:acetylornithine deacetylase/succinyl-diaminopimelate desuccinylase-like protein
VDRDQFIADLGSEGARRWEYASPWLALGFRPNCNVAGLTAGYQGQGAKTVIPSRASAKIDFRLVADQDPDEIFDAVAQHLRAQAPGADVKKLAAVPPSATSPDLPIVRRIVTAVEHAVGTKPLLRPRLGGTTPDYVFTRVLEIPSVLVPYGPPDMNHHAPNERMTLAALERGVACTVEMCRRLAQEGA